MNEHKEFCPELSSGDNIHKEVLNHNGMSKQEFVDFIYPLTTKDFSEMIQISVSTVGNWARGDYPVPRLLINNISKRAVLNYFKCKDCVSSRKRLKKEFKAGVTRAVEFKKSGNW